MPRLQIVRFGLAIGAELLLCAALNLFDDWTRAEMPVRFVAAAIACGIAYLAAVSAFPIAINIRRQALLFWSIAIALRLLALPLEPGDDFWRYQWEGKIQHAGFNPYVHAPDDPALAQVKAEFAAWPKINHPHFRAIYPPGAELLFALFSAASDGPLFYKLVFATADLATAAVLLLLIGGRARYASAAWYAWNPLVVYSFTGSTHFDSLMVLPMVAGVLFLTRIEQAKTARAQWLLAGAAAVLLGVAISIKLIPLLLLPLCAFALRRRAIVLAASVAIPALLSLLYGYPRVPFWDSLGAFAYVTRLNDLFWWLVEAIVWPNPRQKNHHYNRIAASAAVIVSLIFIRDWKRGMLWVLGTALILTPVLHPWYCTWILPFATWRRVPPWHVLSVSVFAYFLFWTPQLFTEAWRAEPWLRMMIIAPPLLAALLFARSRPALPTPPQAFAR